LYFEVFVIILNNHIVINYSYIVIKLHYYYVRLLKTCDANFHNQSTHFIIITFTAHSLFESKTKSFNTRNF